MGQVLLISIINIMYAVIGVAGNMFISGELEDCYIRDGFGIINDNYAKDSV